MYPTTIPWVWMTVATMLTAGAPARTSAAPYPQSTVITNLEFDFSKHDRRALGSDNWALTWGSDDNQYASWGDGFGFDGGTTKISLGYSRITGSRDSWTGRDVFGSENAETFSTISGKSYAILSLGGVLYSFVSPGSENQNITKATLCKSTNQGHSWTPTSVEFTAATHSLMLPCFLQFGRDYAGARDNYVYAYFSRVKMAGWGMHKPGEIVLTRVPRTAIEDQSQYQFVSGFDGSGNPTWSGSVGSAVPVFRDPEGVLTNSVVYHPGLARYLLITVHTDWQSGNLAFFDAPQPWGPWTTVRYYTNWPEAPYVERSAFYANFSPKWFGPGSTDFVLVYTGTSTIDAWNSVPGRFVLGTTDVGDVSAPRAIGDVRPGP